CRVFLSLSHREGLGLPPLEALACGCLVVGFTGYAGVEYFNSPAAVAVEDGDVGALAREVERVVAWSERDPDSVRQVTLKASLNARETYSQEAEARSLIDL